MTAPRKPVAWMDGKGHAWADEAAANLWGPPKPLYDTPNLQPLWALVEDWSSEASAAMDNSNNCLRRNDKISSEQWGIHGSKLRQCAAALRIQLEAMQ